MSGDGTLVASTGVITVTKTGGVNFGPYATALTLPVFTSGAAGVVPASGGGTANFMRADGAWAPPSASTAAGGTNGQIQVNSSGSLAGVTQNGTGQPVGSNGAASVVFGTPATVSSASANAVFFLAKSTGAFSNLVTGLSNSNPRWSTVLGDSTAESGSNTGSNFALTRYTDAGGVIDNPISVNRATGQATFAQPINAPGLDMRNRLINGDFRFDQRNNYGTVTPVDGNFVADRWKFSASQASKLSSAAVNNSGLALIGGEFQTYLEMTVLSAATIVTGDHFGLFQIIEGVYWYDLGFGLSGAKPVAFSFWVNTTVTGTHSGSIRNDDASRSYPFTFSVPTANVWTKIVVPIAGDSGSTWQGFTNGAAAIFAINLGAGATYQAPAGFWGNGNYVAASGSVNVVANAAAKFRITGLQIEQGLTATAFERRPYAEELRMCQRYYQQVVFLIFNGAWPTALNILSLKVTMRVPPNVTVSALGSGSGAAFGVSSEYIYQNAANSVPTTATLLISSEM
jgi:hypothetical protein